VPTTTALEQAELPHGFDNILPEPNSAVDGPLELAGFRGKLQEIGLPSLLGILELERRTGMIVLNLEPGRGKAYLLLSEGRVLRAHLDNRVEPRNAELVYGLIAGTRGTFDFRPSGVVFNDEIQCSTTRLLLEGARRMNEALPSPIEAHPASSRGCRDGAARVDRLAPALGESLGLRAWLGREKRRALPKPARRWISAKDVVAVLAMAAFVMVVLTAVLGSANLK
jgi:hypothetical protein